MASTSCSILDGLTFAHTARALKDLEDKLKCALCSGPPLRPRLLNRCGHSLCSVCVTSFPGGLCPVSSCGVHTPAGEVKADRVTEVRWDAVNRLNKIIQGQDENEGEGKDECEGEGKGGCSVPPRQKDLFLDTPDEGGSQQNKESSKIVCSDDLFSAAEDSVRVLEDDCQEAGKVLEELQSDWSTQQTNKNRAGIKKTYARPKKRVVRQSQEKKGLKATETESCKPKNPVIARGQRGEVPSASKGTFNKIRKNPPVTTRDASTTKKPVSKMDPQKAAGHASKKSFLKPPVQNASVSQATSSHPKTTHKVMKINSKGETLLHRECIKGNLARVTELLSLGAIPNTQDNAGWTPLHEVAQKGFTDIARALLENGANANVPAGDENLTPLHDACASGWVNIVVLLARFGAKKEATDSRGRTPSDVAFNDAVRTALKSTKCNISDSQLLETSIANITAASATDGKKFVLAFALGQDPAHELKLKEATKILDFRLESKVIGEVTHFVVPVSKDRVMEAPGLDYYLALMTGKWIVTFQWILDSVDCGSFVDEEEYQVRGTKSCPNGGPEKARLNSLQQLPKLFKGCNIFLLGKFSSSPYLDKQDIAEILTAGDATVLKREPDPEAANPSGAVAALPYHAGRDSALADCFNFIVYQEGSDTEPRLKYNMKHIRSLPAAWLFECIDTFSIVEPFA